ncbi:MAG: methylenetetrahydrofolate reductase [NAD(P)H] [Dermatophilaceae bacterium]|jgi:methylenetetrahydrofolate reductase (NADPH)|nr:methylenetetrahydrofolate reductase [NAD(P)H] [Actinomycetales bacterium]MBP8880496.1 methylenetetrahydrofolate reductase [NAD(P)H] [Dermatophilaceae bacterium]MBP9917885.1 methylenetetrahydrofolate reductase [NAD(P)H] [Dermatophilaceae bacterium]
MSSLRRPEHVVRSIPDALSGARPAISFEFFPPKDDAGEAVLWETIRALEKTRPTFVSVTYGAGGSSRDRTIRVTDRIARETTMTPMAHLTCVGHSVTELRNIIGHYANGAVRNILALRGDPQGGLDQPWVSHPEGFDHAEELVTLIRKLGPFTVGVAAFPDRHPESPSLDADADVLVRKADAGAAFAISQFFFTTDAYVRLRDRVAARGRDLPIIPGLMPVTNVRQLARMTELSGQPVPESVTSRLLAVDGDPTAVREVGVEIATELAQQLLDEGAPGLHFITMNRSPATLHVWRNLGLEAAQWAASHPESR